MLKLKAVSKLYDRYGRVAGYILSDEFGNIRKVYNNDIKDAIKSGKVNVINLMITKDDRLIKKEANVEHNINKVNVILESYPYTNEANMIALYDINYQQTYFVTSQDYNLIKDDINIDEDLYNAYKNSSITVDGLLKSKGVHNYREEYLLKYKYELEEYIDKALELLIVDNGNPSIAIWSETSRYNKRMYSLSKNKSEIIMILSGVGFKNFKIINGKANTLSTSRPIILNMKDLHNTEIFCNNRARALINKRQICLIQLDQNDDPHSVFSKIEDTEIKLNKGRCIGFTTAKLITKDNTVLGNFDVIDDMAEGKQILSKAKTVYMWDTIDGIMKFSAVNSNTKKYVYVNSIKISDNTASVEKIITDMKNTKSISNLISANETEVLASQFKYKKDEANNKIYIDIPGTDIQVIAHHYTRERYKSLHSILEVCALKNRKTYKKICNTNTGCTVNGVYCPEIKLVGVVNNSIQIRINNITTVVISVA